MQICKLLSVVILAGVAHAVALERRRESRSACILREAQQTARDAPAGKADVAICYHGGNNAYDANSSMHKDSEHFGGLRWTQCGKIGLDCFWMTGDNKFRFYGDGGSDNIAIVYKNNNCVYNRDAKSVTCYTSGEW